MSQPIPVPSGTRPIPVQPRAVPKPGAATAHAKSYAPQAPIIGSLPAPRFSLDMPDISLPPASPEAWSLAAAASAPKPAPRVIGVSSAPAVSFMGKAARSSAELSSSPTVLSILQQRSDQHAGRPAAAATGIAGEAALTTGLRGFSISGASDPFAKAHVAGSSPLRPAEGGLAAALQQQQRPPAGSGSSGVGGAGGAAPAPKPPGGTVLLSASFRDAGSYMASASRPVAIREEEEETQDAALDSSDDEAAARARAARAGGGPPGAAAPAAAAAAHHSRGGRADSLLSEDEEEEEEDEQQRRHRGARDEAADELQL